jgi:hypothetical protein
MLYVFLLLLSFVVHCEATLPKILFTFQSQGISFQQWFDLFTLCLAPLVAHVAGGVVSPTLLGIGCPSPSWSARLPHFNPISIIWRYYVIGDRRLRARSWDEADMAACNAVFWDGERQRWDGSEEIMAKSRAWITKIPEKPHVAALSASSVTSIVLTLQGVNATFLIIAGLIHGSPYRLRSSLAGVFSPLGCLGFVRLPAAFWLSSDYGYINYRGSGTAPDIIETPLEKAISDNILQAHTSDHLPDAEVGDRLHPAHCRQGILYRVFWMLMVWGLLGAAAGNCSKIWWNYPPSLPYNSISNLIFQVMYLTLTVASILIHTVYVVIGKSTSTIIPCIHATWYKIFTLLFMVTALFCVLFSALETRVRLNGSVTSLPEFKCGKAGGLCYPVRMGQGNSNI